MVLLVVLGGFGSFRVVLGRFGWFWVVPCFSNYGDERLTHLPGDDDCIDESLESWSSNTPASLCSHFCLKGNGKKLLVSE